MVIEVLYDVRIKKTPANEVAKPILLKQGNFCCYKVVRAEEISKQLYFSRHGKPLFFCGHKGIW
jgi:hypothetical protein